MSNKFNKSLMYTLLLTVTILCSVNVIMSCNRINKRHHHMSNHIVTWPASTTKCFYFIDWHNGLVGIFDSEDFSQRANCPVDSFYKTVHGFGSYQEIVLIELKNNQELNKLKVENGYPPDDTY